MTFQISISELVFSVWLKLVVPGWVHKLFKFQKNYLKAHKSHGRVSLKFILVSVYIIGNVSSNLKISSNFHVGPLQLAKSCARLHEPLQEI